MSKVIECRCESEYQDKVHGKNKRVHNEVAGKTGGWRCTVCGSVKPK